MAHLRLPLELLLFIDEDLGNKQGLNALARTCTSFYIRLNRYLYRLYGDGAAQHNSAGNEHLVCALLETGARLWVEPEHLASITEFDDILFAQEEESAPSDVESTTDGEGEDRHPDDQEKIDLWYLDMDVRRQEMGLAWNRDRMWPLLKEYGVLMEH
ncbi:hypothetical protein BJY01DRAFT_250370 [Aspergillus pseudoustus]|uniref:F-box domain-containing protein n=1 Tax=Aspergillus pseudoustus TaxID=1810923 RepID=A0ABR4JHW4_9EURO